MKTLLSILIFFMTFVGVSHSQDVVFSQFNNNRLYLNPGYTGTNLCPQLNMTYRNQWPALGSNYVTSMVSYEQFVDEINGGLGVLLINDRSGGGMYSLNGASLFISNEQKLNRSLNIRVGFEGSYKQRFLDTGKLNFEDSFNGVVFTPNTSESFPYVGRHHYFDISTGAILFSDKFNLGISAHHLNRPDVSLVSNHSYLPIRYSIHGSKDFKVRKRYYDYYITPHVAYFRQGAAQQYMIITNVKNEVLMGGVGFRGVVGQDYGDAVFFNFGINMDDLSFIYSYDLTVSRLTPGSGGSHEISVIIKTDCRGSGRSHPRYMPNPSF